MSNKMWRGVAMAMAVVSMMIGIGAGCEGSGDSDNGGDTPPVNAFLGTWLIFDQTAGDSASPYYVHFMADNTFFFSTQPDGTSTPAPYTITNGTLNGTFTNPGVGDGAIEATIVNNVLHLSFIEYWHTPANVVPYQGTKL